MLYITSKIWRGSLTCRNYSKKFDLLPFYHRRSSFQVTLHSKGCSGRSSKKIFERCSYRTYGNMFLLARKLKKNEGIEENCMTTLNASNLGLFATLKKTILTIEFQKRSLRYFWFLLFGMFFCYVRSCKQLILTPQIETTCNLINSFLAEFPFFTPWKHQKTSQGFSDIFRVYKKGNINQNGLIKTYGCCAEYGDICRRNL